jgi:hypothetical protein
MKQPVKQVIARIVWSYILLASVGPQVGADQNNIDLEADIRSVIEVQLRAFARGDVSKAYAQASPEIRKMFPTQDIFMMMIRAGYRPLITPRNIDFLELVMDQNTPIYRVGIESSDGKRWIAFYRMEQQPGGNWLIAGCVLVVAAGQSV